MVIANVIAQDRFFYQLILYNDKLQKNYSYTVNGEILTQTHSKEGKNFWNFLVYHNIKK